MSTIMDSIAMEDYRLNHWKGRAEQSEIERKNFIIKYSLKDIFGENVYDTPCIMIFKYREDCEKLKIVNKMIGNILHKLSSERIPKRLKLERELKELENFVEKCNFLKIDYGDGRFFRTKFHATNQFLEEDEDDFRFFDEWEVLIDYYFISKFKKINNILVQRGLFSIH